MKIFRDMTQISVHTVAVSRTHGDTSIHWRGLEANAPAQAPGFPSQRRRSSPTSAPSRRHTRLSGARARARRRTRRELARPSGSIGEGICLELVSEHSAIRPRPGLELRCWRSRELQLQQSLWLWPNLPPLQRKRRVGDRRRLATWRSPLRGAHMPCPEYATNAGRVEPRLHFIFEPPTSLK